MIYASGTGPTMLALATLSNLPYTFEPTGSRFYGNELPDTDFDFFVENDFAVGEKLLKAGFFEIDKKYVASSAYVDNVLRLGHVDVIIVKDADKYRRVRNAMSGFAYMSKVQQRHLWTAFLEFAHSL
jgi:hypothetical protein